MRFLIVATMAVLCLAAAAQNGGKQQPTRLHINGGELYTSRGVPILLHGVDALISPGAKPDGNMDGKIVLIDRGTIGLSYDSLSKLLNQKMQGGKVQDLKVSSDQGQIKINGKVRKGLLVPFEVKGPVTVTSDGKLDLHASTEKAAKLPIGGIADALGLNMQNVVGSKKGVKGQGQEVIFDPDQLWGLPIHSHVTSARVEKNELVLVVGSPSTKTKKRASVQASKESKGRSGN